MYTPRFLVKLPNRRNKRDLELSDLWPLASALCFRKTENINIQRRILGSSVVVGRNGAIIGVDFEGLIDRFLLFDGYVMRTVRFKEVPHLLKGLGYDQTLELLISGLLEIRCEVMQIASEREAELRKLQRPTFSLIWIQAHDWEKYVADCLHDVQTEVSLPLEKWRAIESAIRNCIRPLKQSVREEIGASFISTAYGSPSVVSESLRLAARKRRTPLVLPKFDIHVEKNGDFIHVETDLRYTRIPKEELWEIFRDGLMGVGTLEQNIGEMKNYEAIGGFSRDELPVYQGKLSALADTAYSGHTEARVMRIAKLTGLPRFDPAKTRLNIDKLLRARESDELRTFRDWLPTSDNLHDADVRQLLKGYRAVTSGFLRGGAATMVRLMIENVVGLMNPIAGTVLSVLDSFIVDKLFPRSGPAAFVNKTYPSLFEGRKQE